MFNNFKKSLLKSIVTYLIVGVLVGLIGLTSYEVNATVPKKSSNKIIYKNEKFGFLLTFPSNWAGKYKIKETKKGIEIYFKPKEKVNYARAGWLFSVLKKTKDLDESKYDTFWNQREVKIKGTTYFIGGPTDTVFPTKNPEFKIYLKMRSQVAAAANSIKEIKE